MAQDAKSTGIPNMLTELFWKLLDHFLKDESKLAEIAKRVAQQVVQAKAPEPATSPATVASQPATSTVTATTAT